MDFDDYYRYLLIKKGLSSNSVRLCIGKAKKTIHWLEANKKELNNRSVEELLYVLKKKGLKNNSINAYIFGLRFLKDYHIDRNTYNGFFEGFVNLPKNSTQTILVTIEELECIWNYQNNMGA